MNRLTHSRSNGIKTGYWSPNKKEELVNALANYEDTGISPESVKEIAALLNRENRLHRPRLTFSRTDGSFGIEGIMLQSLDPRVYAAMIKLKRYEDSGLSPDDIEQLIGVVKYKI